MKIKRLLIISLLLTFCCSLIGFTISYANAENNASQIINFENQPVSESGGWNAGVYFQDDSSDSNWGQDPAGTWTAIAEKDSNKYLTFTVNASQAQKLLRLGKTDSMNFTFGADIKFDTQSLTQGALGFAFVSGLKSGVAWSSNCVEAKFGLTIVNGQHYVKSNLYERVNGFSNIGQEKYIPLVKNEVMVVGNGSEISVYLNGMLIQKNNINQSVSQGDVGLLLYGENANKGATICIDNIKYISNSDYKGKDFEGGNISLDNITDISNSTFIDNQFDMNSKNMLVDINGVTEKQLTFTTNEKAGLVSRMLRLGRFSLADFTFSFDFDFENETLTEGAISVIPFVRLQGAEGWQSKGWEPKTTLSTDGNAYYLMNRFYKRPYSNSCSTDVILTHSRHNITVVGEGDKISVYIDGVLTQSNLKNGIADGSYKNGDIGILVYSENANVGAKVNISNISVLNIAKPPEQNFKNIGASVRLSEPTGLGFGISINKVFYDGLVAKYGLENVKTGTIIIKNDMVNSDVDLTVNTIDVLNVVNNGWKTDLVETEYNYRGSVVNIPESDYNVELKGRGYIELNIDGNLKYLYTETLTRSIRFVAQKALEDTDSQYTAEQKKILNKFCGNSNQ